MKLKDTRNYKKSIKESTAPGFKNRKFGEPLPTLASIQKEYNRKGKKLNEEYIEVMDIPKMLKYMQGIEDLWKNWKRGPMTEKSDIKPAAKELKDYLRSWFSDKIK